MKKNTLFNNVLGAILFLTIAFTANAQLQNANWCFGNQTGLNFNDGTQPVTVSTNSLMSTDGGAASVSDGSGNLLFYTNGINVWDNTHTIMPDGSGLLGSATVSQSAIIVPDPNDINKYYIFTNQGQDLGSAGLSYSVVNMTLNAGLGNIDNTEKNVPLLANSSEKLTAVLNPNDNTYWVVSFGPSGDPAVSDTFYSFKVDNTGVTLANQSTFTFEYLPNTTSLGGQMKISPDALNLALINNTLLNKTVRTRDSISGAEIINIVTDGAQSLFTFDFENLTGAVTSVKNFFQLEIDIVNLYGVEFSPDSNFLYVSATKVCGFDEMQSGNTSGHTAIPYGRLYQIDYRNDGQTNIPTKIYEGPNPIYGLQLGIDEKIYTINTSGNMSTINTPDILGFGADYVHENINLNGNATKELPQLVPNVTAIALVTNQSDSTNKSMVIGNPFKDELKIDVTENCTIEFYNSLGVKIKTVAHTNMSSFVDTKDLPQDIYFLVITDAQSKVWNETVLKI